MKNQTSYKHALLFITLLCLGLLSACQEKPTTTWPGYVEGKYLFITANLAGTLKSVDVRAGDQVKANKLLYALQSIPEQAEFNTAEARLAQANADERKARAVYDFQKSNYDRKKSSYNKKTIKKEEFDSAKSTYNQANAMLSSAKANADAAKAQLKKLQWLLEQKTVTSPIDALVSDVYFQAGENVTQGIPIMALLAAKQVKVIFYVKGADLHKFKLTQTVNVRCEDCTQDVQAKISYISPQAEFTPPVLYSSEVSAKLTFRIEATPESTNDTAFLPGQPVIVAM